MKRKYDLLWIAAGIFGLALSTSLATAQEGGESPEKTPEKTAKEVIDEAVGITPSHSGDEAQERIRKLFGEVEEKLKDIDILLSDAAAGDTSALVDAEEAGISKLLRNSLEAGRAAQKDIEEIIQIAKEMNQQQQQGQGQGQGKSQPSSSGSPLDRGQQSQSQEQTPSNPEPSPGDEPGGEEPKPGQDDPSGEPESEGQKPDDGGKPDDADGENRTGDSPSGDEVGTGSMRTPADEGWGNLPSHVRDTFRSEGRAEMPVRYRDWIDSYYHKLNRRGSRR